MVRGLAWATAPLSFQIDGERNHQGKGIGGLEPRLFQSARSALSLDTLT